MGFDEFRDALCCLVCGGVANRDQFYFVRGIIQLGYRLQRSCDSVLFVLGWDDYCYKRRPFRCFLGLSKNPRELSRKTSSQNTEKYNDNR